jgi:large subunit ribosomal protein L35
MNKPIYRYLADKKWREMKRKILLQRITQMSVTPDVLPEIDPVLDIDLIWHHRTITPGDFVPSTWSEKPPELKIQKFDKGEMLVTIAAVDSDVPNLETDSFDARCHGIWTNIAISPTKTDIGKLGRKNSENSKTAQTGKAEGIEQTEATEQIKQSMRTVLPWAPPYAQKGSPYHRISLFVFEQPNGEQLSEEQIKGFAEKTAESDMWLRGFASQTGFKPVGVTMFRTQWDENTAAVMERNNIPGADVEFKRKKPEKLPDKYKVKDGLRYRGWKK